MNSPNAYLVPLAVIALELEIDVNALAGQFGDAVTIDAAGLRCVEAGRSRAYLANANAARQAERERIQRQAAETAERIDAANAPLRALLSAIQAQPAAEPGTPALAAMIANDPDIGFNRRGRFLDEVLGGQNTYHDVQQEG
jgi:hypothetical protein